MSLFPIIFSLMGLAILIQLIQLNRTLSNMCALLGAAPGHHNITKREHFSLEMAKAHRIAHPDASPPTVANMGVVDADALFDLLTFLQGGRHSD